MANSTFSIWLDAARPKTLPLAIASITCGSALSFMAGHFSWVITLLALLTALLLQILSNLANDYGDAVKGTDNEHRLGPQRAIQSGAVTPAQMRNAMILNVGLTLISGLSLILLATQSLQDLLGFVALGSLAIVAAIAYTVGSKPYGYQGLGDLSVLIFFGWLGVAGTYYLQTSQFDGFIFLPATACGLLAVGVLNINNLRDIDNDKACGKLTLVVRMGPQLGRRYHLVLLSAAWLCFALFALQQAHLGYWLFALATPLIVKHGLAVYHTENGEALRPMMADIVKCALISNVLFAVGVLFAV